MKPASVLVLGAGFGGLGAAIRLLQAGIDDIVILERADDVGGTWRDNTYPGAACDVPSLVYSYSFAQNPNWSRSYSGSAEILAYIRDLVDRYELRRYIRFKSDVTGLRFDDARGIWTVTTRDERTFEARAVVLANGPLANVSFPKIPGIETYEGHKIHSARWDHSYDFEGKRVAVVGTGASAVQIIPELVKKAHSVKVFQRTPGWVLPKGDYVRSEWAKALFRRFPAAQAAARKTVYYTHELMALGVVWDTPVTTGIETLAKAYLRHAVKDPWLRRQLTPDFRPGCKRMLLTSDYYPALQKPNCKLITWPIATIAPKGIRTSDGIEQQVDCIVFATGFDVALTGGLPFPVVGAGGRSITDEWGGGAKAYKSVSVAGFPNLFIVFGPNSGPGHNSALVYMESQILYIVQAIEHLLKSDLRSIDVKQDVQDRYNIDIQRRLQTTTWNSGCKSWYLTTDGFNAAMYPGFATQFARELAKLDLEDYECTKPVVRARREELVNGAA